MAGSKLLLGGILLLGATACCDARASKKELTLKTYAKRTENVDGVFIKFQAPWCVAIGRTGCCHRFLKFLRVPVRLARAMQLQLPTAHRQI